MNNIVPRFFAQFAEPDAEGRDALAQPDWNASWCPHCRHIHREVGFAFPPPALIAPTLRKAIADEVRMLLLVPFAPSAAYWPRLTTATVAGDGKPLYVFRNPMAILESAGSFRPASLALFAIDFQPHSPADAAAHAAPCGQEYLARPRTSWQSPLDAADRARINIAIRDALLGPSAPGQREEEEAPPAARDQ